jgi:cell division transport system ATP-binding protein
MGVVFQDFRLIDDLSVAANVALPLEVMGRPRAEIERRVDETLEHVGLPRRGREPASDLSGGEQQRVAIARALVGRPSLVLADEPTGSLDVYSANFVLDLLEEVAATGATVIVATHDRMLMAARPHRTIAFEGGRMVGMSAPSRREGAAPGTDTAVDIEPPGEMRAS